MYLSYSVGLVGLGFFGWVRVLSSPSLFFFFEKVHLDGWVDLLYVKALVGTV